MKDNNNIEPKAKFKIVYYPIVSENFIVCIPLNDNAHFMRWAYERGLLNKSWKRA